jgi:NAD(P)-dependent dehydrogenase (short-subunit alcohol dehydrogenase family)
MSAKVAVVAGAGGPLGRATTMTLAAGGLTVVAVDRNERGLGDLTDDIRRFSGSCCCLMWPAVARTPTATSTPRTAVDASGIMNADVKPDAAACGADAVPMRKAAKPDQRVPRLHPRAVQRVTAATARPADTGTAASPACLTVDATSPQRVRSRAAAASSIMAVTRRRGSPSAAGPAAPPAATTGVSSGRWPVSGTDRFMGV